MLIDTINGKSDEYKIAFFDKVIFVEVAKNKKVAKRYGRKKY